MSKTGKTMIGTKVIVRTFSAGVHYGTLVERKGKEVVLENARRIWRWEGAFTLSEVSQHGISTASRLSAAVPEILLTEAIEVIPMSSQAIVVMDGIADYKP